MVIKYGRVVSCHDELHSTNSHDLSSRGPMGPIDKLRPLYIHYHNAYEHQTLQGNAELKLMIKSHYP